MISAPSTFSSPARASTRCSSAPPGSLSYVSTASILAAGAPGASLVHPSVFHLPVNTSRRAARGRGALCPAPPPAVAANFEAGSARLGTSCLKDRPCSDSPVINPSCGCGRVLHDGLSDRRPHHLSCLTRRVTDTHRAKRYAGGRWPTPVALPSPGSGARPSSCNESQIAATHAPSPVIHSGFVLPGRPESPVDHPGKRPVRARRLPRR